MTFAFPEPVTFTAAGEVVDDYSGETVRSDWNAPGVVLEELCGVEPLASTEPAEDGRQAVIVGYRLYFDHAVAVDRTWRATVRGETFAVEGKPADWRNPFTGWAPGTVVQVGATSG